MMKGGRRPALRADGVRIMRPMDLSNAWPWLGLVGLGALHGLNPGMGWLFAVALGLQEQKRRALLTALACLGAGHALAVAAAVLIAIALGVALPADVVKWCVAAALLGLGVVQLFRHAHPRYGSMRVRPRQITTWSFLMASAHGAGLMVLPLVLGLNEAEHAAGGGAHAHHAVHSPHAAQAPLFAGVSVEQATGALATLAHTAGYLLVAGLVALLVYERLGLRMLGRVWINVRLIWALALIVTALLTPVIA
jgi:hypothetical protein